MLRIIFRFILTILLMAVAIAQASTQPATGKCHVILLDVSGSMQQRYANNLKGWLLDPLLTGSIFSPNDRVILRSFDMRGRRDFNVNDPQRLYNGNYDRNRILESVPKQAFGQDTDLAEAIDLAVADVKGLSINGDVLIWMITDNEEDAHGVKEIDPLYQRIGSDNNFRSAYLFPLTNENGISVAPQKPAMVMYLLHYSLKEAALKLDGYADEIGRKINNDPITWFPINRSIVLNDGNLKVNGEQAQMVDGRLVLPDVVEGSQLDFTIDFQFKSQLRGRDIKNGKLQDVKIALNLPESVQTDGDLNDWSGSINPPVLRIKPKQRSSEFYQAHITANNLSLHPSTFWQAVWNDTSTPINGDIKVTLNNVDTEMDGASLSKVRNLNEIKKIVDQSQNKSTVIPLGVTFHVAFNSAWRRLLAGVTGLFLLGMFVAVASLFFFKSRYELSSVQGEQILSFPLLGRTYLSIGNEHAAVLQRRLGGLVVATVGEYSLDSGRSRSRSLNADRDAFALENQADGKRYEYTIRRLINVKPTQVPQDDFLN